MNRAAQQRNYQQQENLIAKGTIKAGPIGTGLVTPMPVRKYTGPSDLQLGMQATGQKVNAFKNLFKNYFSKLPALPHLKASALFQGPSPTPSPTPTAIPTPTPNPQREKIRMAIESGFKNWGSPPAATLSGQMADLAMKYPVFQKYPYMLPALTLNETGGGKKTKRPNNFTNWGVYEPTFNPATPMEAIDKTASGIGERSQYYKKFRETQNLEDFSNVYAPESDNPGTGGSNYTRNLQQIMNVFKSRYK